MDINRDVVHGKWKQAHGNIRHWRGGLLQNYRERILGRLEHHVGVLQERRGILRGRLLRAARKLRRRSSS